MRRLAVMLVLMVVLTPWVSNSQVFGDPAAYPPLGDMRGPHPDVPLGSALTRVTGEVTNGLSGGVAVLPPYHSGDPPTVCVFVSNTNRGEMIALGPSVSENLLAMPQKVASAEWLYYRALNSFCGPIELRDAQGRIVPLLRPELSQAEAYPPQYDWNAEHAKLYRGVYIGHGSFPEPLLGTESLSEIVRFGIESCFKVTEAGEYKLTVWPKVYRRTEKDKRICARIDLPPVSVTIKWEPAKK